MTLRRNVRRWVALVALGGRRVFGRLRSYDRARLLLSIGGVALAIAFLVVVTSISLGLTTQSTVHGSNVDYWMTPESAEASTMPVSVGGPEFGAVHVATQRIESIEGVDHATPVAVEALQVEHGSSSAYVILLGVIPGPGVTVAGLPAGTLTPGDPMFANGTYNGTRTGEIVISEAAGTVLHASSGDTVRTTSGAGGGNFTVVEVSPGTLSTGSGTVPIGVVHLAELQSLQSSPPTDTADQFLVQTNSPGVQNDLKDVYSSANVVAGNGFSVQSFAQSDLALAVALSAFLVALVVGVLFTGTTLGLDVAADRPQYATLSALGISKSSQGIVVATQTLAIVTIGGVLGLGLGVLGAQVANYGLETYFGASPAFLHPLVLPYGLGVAVLIGVLAVPYLVWLTSRTEVLGQLNP